MIEFTDAAAEEVNCRRTEDSGNILRVACSSGGCGGFEYFMEFDRLREGDETLTLGDLTVAMDPHSLPFLERTKVDYVEGENGSEFSFETSSPPAGSGST